MNTQSSMIPMNANLTKTDVILGESNSCFREYLFHSIPRNYPNMINTEKRSVISQTVQDWIDQGGRFLRLSHGHLEQATTKESFDYTRRLYLRKKQRKERLPTFHPRYNGRASLRYRSPTEKERACENEVNKFITDNGKRSVPEQKRFIRIQNRKMKKIHRYMYACWRRNIEAARSKWYRLKEERPIGYDHQYTKNEMKFRVLFILLFSMATKDIVLEPIMRKVFQTHPITPRYVYEIGPKRLGDSIQTIMDDLLEKGEIHGSLMPYKGSDYAYRLAKAICTEHGGQVPCTFEELTSFDGIGDKIAMVSLEEEFGATEVSCRSIAAECTQRFTQ